MSSTFDKKKSLNLNELQFYCHNSSLFEMFLRKFSNIFSQKKNRWKKIVQLLEKNKKGMCVEYTDCFSAEE